MRKTTPIPALTDYSLGFIAPKLLLRAGSVPFLDLLRELLCLRTCGRYADPRPSRQEDKDAKAKVESQDDKIPLFEDEDSAAWASFSSNVAAARESLSSAQVRTL